MLLKTQQETWDNGTVRSRATYYAGSSGMKVLHGKKTEWTREGKKHLEIEYTNGKRNGVLVEWYPNGHRAREGRLAADREVGVWTGWHPTGSKAWECTYQDGRIVGEKRYWIDGRLVVEEVYDENGHRAEVTQWHENGARAIHGTFRNDRKHGQWTYWDELGNMRAQGEWRDGKPWEGVCEIVARGDAGSWAGLGKFVRYRKGKPLENR